MIAAVATTFEQPRLAAALDAMPPEQLDELDFGVIGFDADERVDAYNRFESEAAGLARATVVGRLLFDEVAPCMNNFMVAQRFVDAADAGLPLDATIDYVLTLRMRPVRVALRLLATPGGRRYVLVRRAAS